LCYAISEIGHCCGYGDAFIEFTFDFGENIKMFFTCSYDFKSYDFLIGGRRAGIILEDSTAKKLESIYKQLRYPENKESEKK